MVPSPDFPQWHSRTILGSMSVPIRIASHLVHFLPVFEVTMTNKSKKVPVSARLTTLLKDTATQLDHASELCTDPQLRDLIELALSGVLKANWLLANEPGKEPMLRLQVDNTGENDSNNS